MKHRRMRVAIAINLLMAEGIFIATLVVIVKVWILKLSSSGPEAISTAIGTLLIEACEALIVPLQEVVSSSFCFCICHLLLSLLPLLQLLSTNPFSGLLHLRAMPETMLDAGFRLPTQWAGVCLCSSDASQLLLVPCCSRA